HDIVRVRGADDDRADVVRIAQTDVDPRLATVGRLVDAVAARFLAGAGVQNLRVRRRDRQRADRSDASLVEDRRPGLSGVAGFPDAAAGRAEVIGVGV